MNCIFLRRGYPEVKSYEKFTSLAEMFAGAETYAIKGRNSSSAGTFSITNIPTTGTYYIFSFLNGYMAVNKLVNGAAQLLLSTGTNLRQGVYISGTTAYFSQNGTSSASVYGATMAILSFPTFKESAVDAAISGITVTTRKGWAGDTTGRVGIKTAECSSTNVVIAATKELMSVYLSSSVTSSSALKSVFNAATTQAASYSTTYGLNCGSTYGSTLLAVNSSGI